MTNNSVSSRNKKISIIKVMKMVRNSILIAVKENLGKNKRVYFFVFDWQTTSLFA